MNQAAAAAAVRRLTGRAGRGLYFSLGCLAHGRSDSRWLFFLYNMEIRDRPDKGR